MPGIHQNAAKKKLTAKVRYQKTQLYNKKNYYLQ